MTRRGCSFSDLTCIKAREILKKIINIGWTRGGITIILRIHISQAGAGFRIHLIAGLSRFFWGWLGA